MFTAIFLKWNMTYVLPIVFLGFALIPFVTGINLSNIQFGQVKHSKKMGIKKLIQILINHEVFKTNLAHDDNLSKLDSIKNGASDDYKNHISPLKFELENFRGDMLDEFSKKFFYATLGTAITLPLFIFLGLHLNDMDITLGSLVIIAGLFYWAFGPSRKYNLYIKEKVYTGLVTFLGESNSYSPTGGNIKNKALEFGVIPRYDAWYSEDSIKLKHEEVSIEVEEAIIKKEKGSGKRRRKVTIFRGLLIIAEMNKNFKGQTIAKADLGKIGNWFGEKFSKLEKVSLEDPLFEKEFEVYSSDQVEARYLLTAAFMERIQKLKDFFQEMAGKGTGDFQFSFFGNDLMIMIPCSKNLFEPHPLTEPSISVEEVANFLQEMTYIFEVIDQLKLNMNIGM